MLSPPDGSDALGGSRGPTALLAAVAVALTWPACPIVAHGTGLSAQVVDTPDGRVELLGLERWSPEMVMDSIEAHAPDAPPGRYPMTLRELGFARAQASPLVGSEPPLATLVTLVEGHRSELVRLRSGFGPPGEPPAAWSELADAFADEGPAFQSAVNLRWLRGADGELPAAVAQRIQAPGRTAAIQRVWEALDALDAPADLEAALSVLADDGAPTNRTLAAAVASGFPDDDRAWLGLVEALLDPSAQVTATANQALGSMVATRAVPVDWSPAAPALRSLIAGANLPAWPLVLQVLTSTEISPEPAPAILRGSGVLLIDHLGSEMSPYGEAAHALLVRLRGEDLGQATDPWEAWIEGL